MSCIWTGCSPDFWVFDWMLHLFKLCWYIGPKMYLDTIKTIWLSHRKYKKNNRTTFHQLVSVIFGGCMKVFLKSFKQVCNHSCSSQIHNVSTSVSKLGVTSLKKMANWLVRSIHFRFLDSFGILSSGYTGIQTDILGCCVNFIVLS